MLKNIKISSKLRLGFSEASIITVIVGIIGILNVHRLNNSEEHFAIIQIAAAVVIGVILSLLIGRRIAKSIGEPLESATKTLDKLAIGDIDADSLIVNNENDGRKDEIGELYQSLRKLIKVTKEQVDVFQEIAKGDLTVKIAPRSEKDMLFKSLRDLVERLNQSMTALHSTANQVAAGSEQLSNSSVTLSQGATEQASSVEELTASIEEIASQISSNAQNADKASELAAATNIQARKGNDQMSEMLMAMDEINDASNEINKIIKVIDDIAFQTNILALNAAVEAARAGQQGKGFAVVAEEVRNLAGKSANAVKGTTELIENSITKVQAGTKIANETAEALKLIAEDIGNATGLIKSIASASDEQAAGIEQINEGIGQVSQVVQSNAASAQESAAACEELANHAEKMKTIVNEFKLTKKNADGAKIPEPKAKAPGQEAEAPMEKAKILLDDGEFGKY